MTTTDARKTYPLPPAPAWATEPGKLDDNSITYEDKLGEHVTLARTDYIDDTTHQWVVGVPVLLIGPDQWGVTLEPLEVTLEVASYISADLRDGVARAERD